MRRLLNLALQISQCRGEHLKVGLIELFKLSRLCIKFSTDVPFCGAGEAPRHC